MGAAAMLDFRALERRWRSGIFGNVKKFKRDNVLDHLKSKNGCSGGAPRVFLAPILLRLYFNMIIIGYFRLETFDMNN